MHSIELDFGTRQAEGSIPQRREQPKLRTPRPTDGKRGKPIRTGSRANWRRG